MPWEWVGPAGTAVVAIAGIAATYWSGRGQVQGSREIAERQARLALLTQREERQQRRIEVAYPVLLDAVAEGGLWVWSVDSFTCGDSGLTAPPRMPAAAQRLEKQGSLSAIWSPQVAYIVREWSLGAGSAYSAAFRLSHYWAEYGVQVPKERNAVGPDLGDVLDGHASMTGKLDGSFRRGRDRMLQAEERLREQVWKELRVESGGDAELAVTTSPPPGTEAARRKWRRSGP